MPIFSSFNDWENLSYSPYKKMIAGFAPAWDKAMFNLTCYNDDLILRDLSTELYQIYRSNEIPFCRPDRIPSVNFSHSAAKEAIETGFPEGLMINNPKLASGTKKIDMHKKLAGKDYVPKTAFSEEEAIETLKFPIIAKASKSQGSIGVFQYKTPQELIDAHIDKIKEEKKKPDLFCEKISIEHEFRMVVYIYKTGEVHLIYLVERIPFGDRIKNLREGFEFLQEDPPEDKKSNFEWQLFNPETEEYTPHILNIIKDCIDVNKGVQILAIDFCVDDQGKWWYIECNMHPGMSYNLPISIYYHAYCDYYNDSVFNYKDQAPYQFLNNLAKKYIEYTMAITPEYRKPDFEPNIFGKKLEI